MSQTKIDNTSPELATTGLAHQEVTLLKSDTVLNHPPTDNIHEGQISLTHGFVPYQPISASLPLYYKPWEDLATQLPKYMSEGSERDYINALPLLKVDEEHLPNSDLSRCIAIIGNLAHAYYTINVWVKLKKPIPFLKAS